MLEIWVGSYDATTKGKSLRLWAAQTDLETLEGIAKKYGFGIIIDEGIHLKEHQIPTFNGVFSWLKESGIYVVEDTQSSYWPVYGGGAVGSPGYANSATHIFEYLVEGLNHVGFPTGNHLGVGRYCDQITGLYLEHNMILIVKGKNTLPSNMDVVKCAQDLEIGTASPPGLLG